MKYLCLAYYDEKEFEKLTEADMAAMIRDCTPLDEKLQATGRVVEVGSLAGSRGSISIRPRKGRAVVTDGPYAETKEMIGSYYIIEAKDAEEAVAIASLHPAAQLNEHLGWGVEVRPIEMCRVAEVVRRSEG